MGLIVVCAAALAGVAVGDLGALEPARLLLGAVIAGLGTVLAWQRPVVRVLALVACAAALGGLRASLVPATDGNAALEPYLGLSVRLRGVVAQPPNTGTATMQLVVDAQAIGPAGRASPPIMDLLGQASPHDSGQATQSPPVTEVARQPPPPATEVATQSPPVGTEMARQAPPSVTEVAGRAVRVRVVGDAATLDGVALGEALVLEGRLLASDRPGPPTLLYPRLLERTANPSPEPALQLGLLRAAAQAGIARHLPEPQASLAAGVLLGGAGRLDADFRLQLQRSGLAHVVAIDGFKQVVVAAGLGAVAVRLLGPRAAAPPVLLGIAGYTLLTGAHPAAVRAGLMVGLATLAALTGRLADPLTSVLLAATIMAAVDPRILLDVGLQLSLSATLGIVLLWPRLRPRLNGLPRFVAEPAGLTLAVTLATLPVVLSAFQLVSLVSPLAHVLAVPLLPAVLLSAALLALVAPIPALAAVVAWLAWLPSTLLVAIIRLCGSLPGAALATGRLPPGSAAAMAGGLLVWGIWGLPEVAPVRARVNLDRLRWVRATAHVRTPAAGMAICLLAAGLLQAVRPDGHVHIEHLPAGRGEAVFIRGPTGKTALVASGRLDGVQLAAQVADNLAVWENRLDVVVQLDPDAQTGLGLTLARYPAAQQLEATTDQRLDLGGGAAVDVYAGDGQSVPAVSLSFGQLWEPLIGRPPSGEARPLL